MTGATTVWLSPSATFFACLCEPCLEEARTGGVPFADALRRASVRGELTPDTLAIVAHCPQGHQLVVRRVERPPRLDTHDARQLQLA